MRGAPKRDDLDAGRTQCREHRAAPWPSLAPKGTPPPLRPTREESTSRQHRLPPPDSPERRSETEQ
eukprot:8164659-Alexandrium_andersonii.AAC.1